MAESNELITFLHVKLGPNAKQNMDNFNKGLDTVKNGIKGLNNFLFGAGGMWNYFRTSIMGGSQELINLSKQTGINTDTLQRWKYAAEVSGLSFQALTGDLVEFKKKGQDVASLSRQIASASPRMAQLIKERWGISDDMFTLLKKGPEGLDKLGGEAIVIDNKKLQESAKALQKHPAALQIDDVALYEDWLQTKSFRQTGRNFRIDKDTVKRHLIRAGYIE